MIDPIVANSVDATKHSEGAIDGAFGVEAWLQNIAPAQRSPVPGQKRKRSPCNTVSDTILPETSWDVAKIVADMENSESTSTPPESTSADTFSTPNTNSRLSKLSGLTIKKNPDSIGQAMEHHGLLFENRKAFDRYPEFQENVRKIVESDRSSHTKARSVERFRDKQGYYARANEDTLLKNLVPFIVKDSYTPMRQATSSSIGSGSAQTTDRIERIQQELEEGTGTTQEWWEEGLVTTSNNEFQRTLLPNLFSEQGFEQRLANALAKEKGMKNPKPDYTYGIKRTQFPAPRDVVRSKAVSFLQEISPLMYHAFLIIEGKSDAGQAGEAENQARRGGATLVNAARMLSEKIGEKEADGADDRTFVYSVTLSPQVMEIWVHWAEVVNKETYIHMNNVASISLRTNDAVPMMRRWLHNILEWGCFTRRNQLKILHEKLHEYERREMKELQQGVSKKRKTPPSTPDRS
ncbi:MAG: hypothetical protein Q9217_003994 [Psora testacea]